VTSQPFYQRFRSFFQKKPLMELIQECSTRTTLKRVLSPIELLLLGIGATIGAGIFVITGIAAANYAGPAVVLSFVISGIAALFAALCYVELASMVPCAGSAYTYAYAGLGEIWAWIIGWDMILEYAFAISAVAAGWSGYVSELLKNAGFMLPTAFTNSPLIRGGIINIPAIFIILVITGLLILGVKESAMVNNVIVLLKLGVIFLFLYLAFGHINVANYTPFTPYGWGGVFSGAAVVFFAYIGFDAVTTASEEIEDPRRNIPIGIIGCAVVVMILYISVSAVLTGIVPYYALKNTDAPISFALTAIGISWGSALVSVGAIAGLTSVLLVSLFGQTRIFFAMSRDGLLPKRFSYVHPVYRTPVTITLITGFATALIAGLLPLQIIVELVNIGTLSSFILVAITVMVLRHTHPDAPRPFHTPFVPLVPIICMLFCLGLITVLPLVTLLRFIVWMAVGLCIYVLFSSKHSILRSGKITMPE
jgi:APA family basic amino acid/polyamine antiporter